MPRYRVMIEAKIDIDADDEETAKVAAAAMIHADYAIAWEIENEDDKTSKEARLGHT